MTTQSESRSARSGTTIHALAVEECVELLEGSTIGRAGPTARRSSR